MNQWTGIGNLGADPQISTTASGKTMARFRIAIDNHHYTGSDEDRRLQKSVDWFSVVAWGPLAETVARYLQTGSKVAIVGRLRNHEYIDSDGQPKRFAQINADSIQFLGKIKSPDTDRASEAEVMTSANTEF